MLLLVKKIGRLISKKPKVLRQNIVSINKIKIKKYGSWNCIPHAIDTPICLSIKKNSANKINENMIPVAVYKKLSLMLCDWLFKTDSNFIERTGKTHGIKFKIKPPRIDIRII